MTSEWVTEPLQCVVSYIAKGIPPVYVEVDTDNTVRVLNQKCNRDFSISYSESRLHDLSKRSVSQEKYLRNEDILINSTGTGTAGRIAQLHSVTCPTIVDGHMIVIRGNEKIIPRYLGYALKAQQAMVLQLDEGSTGQTELNRDRLLSEIEVSYPVSLEEQEDIVATLSALDDKIAINTKINHHLEQMAQAIFKSWFIDFEPFGGVMPDDWREGTLSEIVADIVCGKTPSTKVAEYFGDDIPFITIPDMHGRTYVTSTERSLSLVGADSQSSKTIPANSVCVSCIATAGLVVLTSKPSQTNQQINTIVCKIDISPFYVYLMMVEMADHIRMLGSSGSATNNLNKGQFSKIVVLIPSTCVLDEFTTLVTPIFEEIKRNQQESEHLVELRDTLLPRLMSGELSVADLGDAI